MFPSPIPPAIQSLLTQIAADQGQTVTEVLAASRTPHDPFTLAHQVEAVAQSVWRAARQAGAPLPPPDRWHFVARPYEDGSVRLVIFSAARVLVDERWTHLSDEAAWFTAIGTLARYLVQIAPRLAVYLALTEPRSEPLFPPS